MTESTPMTEATPAKSGAQLRAAAAIAECRLLATMTEEPGRTTRRYLTAPVADVHVHLRARMEALGMTVTVDAAGNLRGLWESKPATYEKRLILGSHIDTVPDAGAFDGVLGVVLALHLVEEARANSLPLSIEVIAFSEEEGVRFGVPFLGSRAVAGIFNQEMLAYQDAEGIRMDQAIRDFGLDPVRIPEAALDSGAFAYLEIHIEQGPILEAEGLPLAAVEGIVGQTRLSFRFTGQANHAGTTPMHLRHDALAAAAEWMLAAEEIAKQQPGLVATVGKIAVEPNAGNVIPGVAEVSLDLRHMRNRVRESCTRDMIRTADLIAARRGVQCEWIQKMDQRSVPMDTILTSDLKAAIETTGLPVKTMPSGAGHDAMVMASRVPSAMLFLRSPGGISHHPAETVIEEDVAAAFKVGYQLLRRITERNEAINN